MLMEINVSVTFQKINLNQIDSKFVTGICTHCPSRNCNIALTGHNPSTM